MAMTDEEFDAYLKQCKVTLRRKQSALQKRYGLGTYDKWHFDGGTGFLQFIDKRHRLRVEAEVTEIGTYSSKTQTWMWAWANPSISKSQRAKSARLKQLSKTTGFKLFRLSHAFEVDVEMPGELAAMSVAQTNTLGCYRGQVKHLSVFFAIESIRMVNTANHRDTATDQGSTRNSRKQTRKRA